MALELVNIEDFAPVDTVCLRCGEQVALRFAGPCERCTAELRERVVGEAREIEAEYVPRMNVTPNAVAAKQD